ncbi:MAG: hypothetical protein F4Y16_02035 [Holophagales bacterium]|nr:hypothetical protein [Holophagales bacterium]MYH26420.1 hypothetical protein [Holophagales bacterium]
MKVLQQLKAAYASDDLPPDMRWVMFWLFWALYGMSALEVIVGFRRSSEGLGFSVAAFSALTFAAGGLAVAAWHARCEGVGFLAWTERLSDRPLQSAQLTALVLLTVSFIASTPWAVAIEELRSVALQLGLALTALVLICKPRLRFGRRGG